MTNSIMHRLFELICIPLVLQLLLVLLASIAVAVSSDPACSTAANGVQMCGDQILPTTVCLWRQGIIQDGIPTGPSRSGCDFELRDSKFLSVIGKKPKLEVVAYTDGHEGGVYFPDKQEFYFSSTRQTTPPNIKLMKFSLPLKKVSTVFATTPMSNGMVLDRSGNLLVCQQGKGAQGGFIQRISLRNLNKTSIVADNWFGLPFNSPNDVVVKSDGSIWFTDPDYGWIQGFKEYAPRINNQVYRISSNGIVDAIADGFTKPNGLAFSADEKLLYVTDTGSSVGNGTVDLSQPHSIYVFDVNSDGKTLSNRRLFASVASFDGSAAAIGAPDGIKVDTKGRVYTANPDGIQVFEKDGEVLGLIRVAGAANMGFVGKKLDQMLILNDTAIHSVHLQARGANLFYANHHPA